MTLSSTHQIHGIVKIINNAYKDDPEKFSNRLYNMGLNDKLGVSIKGESKPKIPHPKDKDWSGLSLPWMVYGYGGFTISFANFNIL